MKTNLLIAEPDDGLRETLMRYFARQGFSVRSVNNEGELIREMQRELPQVLLLEPEILCGPISCGAPLVPTVVLTRTSGMLPLLRDNFLVADWYDKPAYLSDVTNSLRTVTTSPAVQPI